jgi:hypothetical protein
VVAEEKVRGRGRGRKDTSEFQFGPCPHCLKEKGKEFDHDKDHCWDLHPEQRMNLNVQVNNSANSNTVSTSKGKKATAYVSKSSKYQIIQRSDSSDDGSM